MSKFTLLIFSLAFLLGTLGCSTQQEEITILIKADKTITVNDELVSLDNLGEKLQALGVNEKTLLKLQPEDEVDMGFLQQVREVIQSTDGINISYMMVQ
jgi:biopolymer transport protein ExbD